MIESCDFNVSPKFRLSLDFEASRKRKVNEFCDFDNWIILDDAFWTMSFLDLSKNLLRTIMSEDSRAWVRFRHFRLRQTTKIFAGTMDIHPFARTLKTH